MHNRACAKEGHGGCSVPLFVDGSTAGSASITDCTHTHTHTYPWGGWCLGMGVSRWQVLLEGGADVNLVDSYGHTALYLAA